ncbi:IclR family transcriptional regulator [Devosia sp. MC532]|uniref:IclR family transcriptional regulator n=1 Tax=Devosia sp. MC532 TaxID=2799788 RepID=UPI0018F3D2C5|nr:IclR family transcriptional regulator [Devosia sp. MC532]MBJ7576804.1 IclR family transcriptional regulator [Devosia sp. MC532]
MSEHTEDGERKPPLAQLKPDTSSGGAQAIHRALHIVRVLSAGPRNGMKLIDIAEATGLSHPTAYRILRALEEQGLVERSADSRRYVIGVEMVWLGLRAAQRFPLLSLVAPALSTIANGVGDTVIMSVRSGVYSVCVERRNGKLPIRVTSAAVGSRMPLQTTPAGLTMLAYLPDRLVEPIIAAADADEQNGLRHQIASVRERGHLVSEGLTVRDTRAITAPVRDMAGNAIAAISVIGTRSRLDDGRLPHIIDALNAGSREASEAIWRNAAMQARDRS